MKYRTNSMKRSRPFTKPPVAEGESGTSKRAPRGSSSSPPPWLSPRRRFISTVLVLGMVLMSWIGSATLIPTPAIVPAQQVAQAHKSHYCGHGYKVEWTLLGPWGVQWMDSFELNGHHYHDYDHLYLEVFYRHSRTKNCDGHRAWWEY